MPVRSISNHRKETESSGPSTCRHLVRSMMSEWPYLKSVDHLANVARAREASLIRCQKLKQQRIEEYYRNPKRCLGCGEPISYEKKRDNKFCGRTCAARHNNIGRVPTSDQRVKTAAALVGRNRRGKNRPPSLCRIQFKVCPVCFTAFYVKGWHADSRQTCSDACAVQKITANRRHAVGQKKCISYFNPHQQRSVILESNWELKTAEHLDKAGIVWHRPRPIRWTDSKSIGHWYYPDFYLPEYDLYLDPKNPWCVERDREKLEKVSAMIALEYGSLDRIIGLIDQLWSIRAGHSASPTPALRMRYSSPELRPDRIGVGGIEPPASCIPYRHSGH